LKCGWILLGWSTVAVERGFTPTAAGEAHPTAPAKPLRRWGGDETHLQLRAGGLSLLLGPVPQLSPVLQPLAVLRHAQTWSSRYVCPCHRQKCCVFLPPLDFSPLKQTG